MQTTTGATRGEVIVVVLLLISAVLGNVLQRLDSGSGPNDLMSPAQIREMLDASDNGRQPIENAVQEPAPQASPSPARQREASTPAGRSTVVNLNTASKTRLMSIPGVGEATADRILQYRSHSPFTRPDDLQNVKGIGEKRFERMRPFITAP